MVTRQPRDSRQPNTVPGRHQVLTVSLYNQQLRRFQAGKHTHTVTTTESMHSQCTQLLCLQVLFAARAAVQLASHRTCLREFVTKRRFRPMWTKWCHHGRVEIRQRAAVICTKVFETLVTPYVGSHPHPGSASSPTPSVAMAAGWSAEVCCGLLEKCCKVNCAMTCRGLRSLL